MRVCFFGDSFTAGAGDDTALGWVGRAVAEARGRGLDLTAYNLGVRGETSADIAQRWEAEAMPRLPKNMPSALVFSFGVNDCVIRQGKIRVPVTQTLDNARTIFERATQRGPVLMIGPPRCYDPDLDARIDGVTSALETTSAACSVPFLPLFRLMPDAVSDDAAIWHREIAAGDGIHPNEHGYALIARIVAAWDAWRATF